MAVLGGKFAMLILVQGEAARIEQAAAGAAAAGRKVGLEVQATPTASPEEARQASWIPYEIEAYSMDHPGIVDRIASCLAERQINVRALETRLSQAPLTGLPLFSLHASIDVPSQQRIAELRRELETLGTQENIDIEVRPAR